MIGAIIATVFLCYKIHASPNTDTKLYSLLTLGFIDGMFIQPLINYAAALDPAIIANALIITTSLFAGLTIISLKAKQRSLLYLGGVASSIMMWMFFGGILSWITGYSLLTGLQYNLIYIVVFSLYTIYDTQMVVAKFERGDTNHFAHALELFIDFVRLFVHILRILIKLSQDGNRKKK